MMELAKVQKYWGIQSSSTVITGRLFTDDLFTFKHQALEYVRKVHESSDLERPEDYVTPVLLNVMVHVASREDTEAYEKDQRKWLDERKRDRGIT
jgi:hypothetical protein